MNANRQEQVYTGRTLPAPEYVENVRKVRVPRSCPLLPRALGASGAVVRAVLRAVLCSVPCRLSSALVSCPSVLFVVCICCCCCVCVCVCVCVFVCVRECILVWWRVW